MTSFSMMHIYLLRILPRILAKTDYFGNFEKAILKYKEKGNINFKGFKCQNWVPRAIPT